MNPDTSDMFTPKVSLGCWRLLCCVCGIAATYDGERDRPLEAAEIDGWHKSNDEWYCWAC
jgi:hypothetical protein